MKDIRAYLHDVLQAIEGLEQIFGNKTIGDLNKLETRWAVERGIAIIGEALFKARKLNENLPITNLQRIINTRHILIHDYDTVDPERLIGILRKHLPLLKVEVTMLIQELD